MYARRRTAASNPAGTLGPAAFVPRQEDHRAKKHRVYLDHQNDSLEQLSAYLKACMDDIGHPPAREEVIGGDFLEYRFESWPKALRSFYSGSVSANLKNPPPFANRKIVRDLYAALDSQLQRADAACTKEVRA